MCELIVLYEQCSLLIDSDCSQFVHILGCFRLCNVIEILGCFHLCNVIEILFGIYLNGIIICSQTLMSILLTTCSLQIVG